MQEFTLPLRNSLRNGLYPDSRFTSVNFALDSIGFEATEVGLRAARIPLNPFNDVVASYPWPQIVRFRNETYLFYEDSVEKVTEEVAPWEVEEVVVPPGSIVPGSQWHTVDMAQNWLATNGQVMVSKMGQEIFHGEENPVRVHPLEINTVMLDRGRVLFAGFDPAEVMPEAWHKILNHYRADLSSDYDVSPEWRGKSWVMWSSIGDADLPMWILFPQGLAGSVRLTGDRLLEKVKRGELGFMPMPWQGTIFALRRLGNRVIVFGDGGIAEMAFVPGQEDVPPTYGLNVALRHGVAGRSCVAGTRLLMYFLDNTGTLWRWHENDGLERLGYEHLLINLIDNDLRMSYDSQLDLLYLSSSSKGFVYNGRTLSELRHVVPQALNVGGAALGLVEEVKAQSKWLSQTVTMALPGLKTVNQVVLMGAWPEDTEVRLWTAEREGESFTATPWRRVNDEGSSWHRVASQAFRVEVRASEAFELDDILIKWHAVDRRYIRGPAAARPEGDIA